MLERRTRSTVVLALFVLLIVSTGFAHAEEGGSGHYFPGSMASFMDGVSATPTFIVRLNVIDYDGRVDADLEIPISGSTALDVDVASIAYGLTLFWRPSWGKIGEKWSYAMSTTIPFVDLTVSGTVQPAGQPAVQRSDSESGLGDILLFPVMFNYQVNPNLAANFRLGVYAPTGDYETGRLANTGKNFWTVEPTAALIYFGQKSGMEASVFFGVDFNEENPDTNYKSGTQMHLESTVAKHFPLWGGMFGAGGTAFWYKQVTDDSGSGANLGGFRSQANGVGPVLSYIRQIGKKQLMAELKWLSEFSNEKRPEGDILFLKVMYKF